MENALKTLSVLQPSRRFDPVSVSSKVALRLGNYELINLLLRFGANVNYYCRVNTTHFPSALQYALKDEVNRYHGHHSRSRRGPIWRPVAQHRTWNAAGTLLCLQVVLRMLCNYGYDVQRCFDCPYGNSAHIPEGYEGWSNSVIKDTLVTEQLTSGCVSSDRFDVTTDEVGGQIMPEDFNVTRAGNAKVASDFWAVDGVSLSVLQFCEVITVSWLKHLSGQVVCILLDYVDHVTLCSKLKGAVMEHQQWPHICWLQGKGHAPDPLTRPNPAPSTLPVSRERSPSEASLPSADPPLPRAPSSPFARVHEFPAVAKATEGLHPVSGVRHARPEEWNIRKEKVTPCVCFP